MTVVQAVVGLARICDAQGVIRQVIYDSWRWATCAGLPLAWLVAASDQAKALNFLQEMRDRGAAVNWELNVPPRQIARSV